MKLFNKNKKGTALITVVGVMFVLLVLVSGTLVLVTAAHNKAMTNYYANQAYITARSLVDTFIEQMCDNSLPKNAGSPGVALTDTQKRTVAIRKAMVGQYDSASSLMKGGMNYDGRATDGAYASSPLPTGIKLPEKIDGKDAYYLDVKVSIPAAMLGYGELYNVEPGATDKSTVRVYRLSQTTFKVIATVKSGAEGKETYKTVTERIVLSPTAGRSMFDSALISQSGQTILENKSQLYGGYVNAGGDPPVFGSNETRYVGNFYSKSKIFSNSGNVARFYLGADKKKTDDGFKYVSNYIQSPSGISLTGCSSKGLIVQSYFDTMPEDEGDDGFRPYLFASGTAAGGDIKIQAWGDGAFIGEIPHGQIGYDLPIDIYANRNVELENITLNGNIYAKGNVKLTNCRVNGHIYCNRYTHTGGTVPPAKTGTANRPFPDPYEPAEYGTVATMLAKDYNKEPSLTIGECFSLGNGKLLPSIKPSPFNPQQYVKDFSSSDMTTIAGGKACSAEIKGPSFYLTRPNVVPPTAPELADSLKITVDEKDMFITYDKIIEAPERLKIELIRDPSLAPTDKMGNVYIYFKKSGDFAIRNAQVNVTNTYPSEEHHYGTRGTDPLDEPSHLFFLMDGPGQVHTAEKNNMNVYIFAPKKSFDFNGSDNQFTGSAEVSYDKENMRPISKFCHSSAERPAPTIVGSCISEKVSIKVVNASIFIVPPDNIFDLPQTSNLGEYQWAPTLSDRK